MDINQFALYQLKEVPENQDICFRSYKTLQENKIQHENYEQKYFGRIHPDDIPESIKQKFQKQTPRSFKGNSISVSDVLVLNKGGSHHILLCGEGRFHCDCRLYPKRFFKCFNIL